MADGTKIEWTDTTWNPIRGCSMARGSELGGCLNCYAARVAARFTGFGMPYEGLARNTDNGPRWTGKVRTLFERTAEDSILHWAGEPLLKPLRWTRPRRIFVNSMSDLFHENLADADVDLIVAVMALARQHTFQVLTKRPERMAVYLNSPDRRERIAAASARVTGGQVRMNGDWPLPNVWWGVSCEDDRTLAVRMPHVIRALPNMAVAWLSAEPLLGPLNSLHLWLPHERDTSQTRSEWYPGLSWVVAGGESGPGARPMNPAWARGIRDTCRTAGVPFLFKQWGEWAPVVWYEKGSGGRDRFLLQSGDLATLDSGMVVHFAAEDGRNWRASGGNVGRVGKKAAGRLLDGETWDQYPADAGKGRVS